MCDVPSIAVFCSESIKCFPGIVSKFFFKLLVTIPVAPVIIIIIPVATFTHDIYNYVPHTSTVPTVYSVAAVLYLQLFRPYNVFCISTSRSLCAVHNMAVVCSSLISRFHGILLRYCLK